MGICIMGSPFASSESAKARALNSTGISVFWVIESGVQIKAMTKAVMLTFIFNALKVTVTAS